MAILKTRLGSQRPASPSSPPAELVINSTAATMTAAARAIIFTWISPCFCCAGIPRFLVASPPVQERMSGDAVSGCLSKARDPLGTPRAALIQIRRRRSSNHLTGGSLTMTDAQFELLLARASVCALPKNQSPRRTQQPQSGGTTSCASRPSIHRQLLVEGHFLDKARSHLWDLFICAKNLLVETKAPQALTPKPLR